MATMREWLRDFKKKPKWDRLCIVLTVFGIVVGLFFGGKWVYNHYEESPSINITNSSEFGFNYKSPNSPITITRSEYYSDSCDSGIYKNTIRYTPSGLFGGGKYNLSNVLINLPSGQNLFMDELIADKEYIIGYTNDDYSSVCVPHQYRTSSDFDDSQVCFMLYFQANYCGDPGSTIEFKPGPNFLNKKETCFTKIGGASDYLENWCSG